MGDEVNSVVKRVDFVDRSACLEVGCAGSPGVEVRDADVLSGLKDNRAFAGGRVEDGDRSGRLDVDDANGVEVDHNIADDIPDQVPRASDLDVLLGAGVDELCPAGFEVLLIGLDICLGIERRCLEEVASGIQGQQTGRTGQDDFADDDVAGGADDADVVRCRVGERFDIANGYRPACGNCQGSVRQNGALQVEGVRLRQGDVAGPSHLDVSTSRGGDEVDAVLTDRRQRAGVENAASGLCNLAVSRCQLNRRGRQCSGSSEINVADRNGDGHRR